MIELLAGPLVGGAVQDKLGSKNWGNLMIALDPSMMGEPPAILHNVQLMLGRVKGARKAEGVEEIMLPGERGNRLAGQLLLCLKLHVPACMVDCVSVCMLAYVSACILACMSTYMSAGISVGISVGTAACMLACMLGCTTAQMLG